MKKILAITLLLLYLPAISGMAISKRFCCGKVGPVKVQLIQKDNCCSEGQDHASDCCDDLDQILLFHEPHQIAVNDISFDAPGFSVFCFYLPSASSNPPEVCPSLPGLSFFFQHFRPKEALFIKYSVFRI